MALVFAGMGWSMLAKGPVGIILPTGIIGLFILFALTAKRSATESHSTANQNTNDLSQNFLQRTVSRLFAMLKKFIPVTWALRPLTGIVVIAAIAAPWYILVGLRTNWVWTQTFFGYENAARFSQAMENHRGPIVYYFPAIMIGFFPWSIFLILSVWRAAKAVLKQPGSNAQRFLLCWVGVWVGVFSIAATKLPSYVLPAYPALAIMVAMMLNDWLNKPEVFSKWLLRCAWISLGIVGVGFAIALPIISKNFKCRTKRSSGWSASCRLLVQSRRPLALGTEAA